MDPFRPLIGLIVRNARIMFGVTALLSCSIGCCAGALLFGHNPSTTGSASPEQTVVVSAPTSTTYTPVFLTPTATAKPKTWVTVEHFTGTNQQQTPTFTLQDGARIVWSATASDQFGGVFDVTSYDADGTYGDLIANASTPPKVSGTYNAHGTQSIYLKIETFGCTYDIAVQVER